MSGCEYYQELISRMCDEELSGEEKDAISHRGVALRKLHDILKEKYTK